MRTQLNKTASFRLWLQSKNYQIAKHVFEHEAQSYIAKAKHEAF
jgi:hypothetical protein